MVDAEIAARVRTLVAQQIGKTADEIGDDDSLTALGVESIDAIELVFALEEAFDIDIPLNANDPNGLGMENVGDVIRSVTALVDAKR